MSGSTGADRIKSREHFRQFLKSYESLIKKFPGFVSIKPSGSYNSDLSKQDFGDIDLITHIQSNEDKPTVKKQLSAWLSKLPDSVIVPFGSEKYKGKKLMNTGEIVTIRYHDDVLGYSVQVDNIIALDKIEAEFKGSFLDLPAEKQGLVLGLVKTATIEHDPSVLFKKLGIKAPTALPKDSEYEFNLSSVELQLRKVTYEPGTYTQKSREVIWKSNNYSNIEKLLFEYDLSLPFDKLLAQAKSKIKNTRSGKRISGVFGSMITVKSGEVGTPKGKNKEVALHKIKQAFGESRVSFAEYRDLMVEERAPVENKQVGAAELQTLLGKGKMNAMLRHPWFQDIRNYEHAFKYAVSEAGFVTVQVYAYFKHVHTSPEGKIRPELMVQFTFSYSGTKVVQAEKYYRDKEPNENEKRFGPSAGWKHLKSWVEVKD